MCFFCVKILLFEKKKCNFFFEGPGKVQNNAWLIMGRLASMFGKWGTVVNDLITLGQTVTSSSVLCFFFNCGCFWFIYLFFLLFLTVVAKLRKKNDIF